MNVRTTRLAAVGMAVVLSGAMDARADIIFSNFDENTQWNVFWIFIQNQPAREYEPAVRFEATVSFVVDALEVPVLNPQDKGFYSPPPPPGTVFGDSMHLAIYADDNGTPGQLLETVEAPDSVPPWHGFGEPMPPPTLVEFAGTTRLEKGQVYWISVFEAEGSVVGWQAADSIALLPRRLRIGADPTWHVVPERRLGLRIYGTPDPQCDGDITDDGVVDVNDLLSVVSTWGSCAVPCPPSCVADIVPNCAVDVNDLLAVVTTWGPCP